MKYVNIKIYYYRPGQIEMHYWPSWTSRKMSGLNQDEKDTWSPVSWPLLFSCPCSSSVVFWVTHLWSFWRTAATTARLSTAFMQRSERPASLPHQKRDLCYSFNVGGIGLGERASTAVGGSGWGKKNLLKVTALVGPTSSLSPEDQPCFFFAINTAHLWVTPLFS